MCHNINIAIGSDHAGVNLKEILIKHLRNKGINVKDFGTNSLDSVDYPDYAVSVSSSVISISSFPISRSGFSDSNNN